MRMDILESKRVCRTLLGVKADGNALHAADIVHRAFLVKIRQRDVAVFLINFDGGDRRRYLLDQRKPFFQISLV